MTKLRKWSVTVVDADGDEVGGKVYAADESHVLDKFMAEYGHFCSEPIKSHAFEELGEGDIPLKKLEEEAKKEETLSHTPYSAPIPPHAETPEEKEARELREKAAKLKPFEVTKPERYVFKSASEEKSDWGAWT